MVSWTSGQAAKAWREGAAARNRMLAAGTERMMAAAGVCAGAAVLDVGTGTGDTALMAAERVGPSGTVVAVDSSPAMVSAAKEAARAAGAANLTVLERAAEALAGAGEFDAVIARNVLMFVDLPRTLAAIRAVLRPGGRMSALVWADLASNPFHAALIEVARGHGCVADCELFRAFQLGDPETYRRALAAAGFDGIAVERVVSERRFDSAAEALSAMQGSPIASAPIAALPESRRAAAWAEISARCEQQQAGDSCVFPLAMLVVSAARS